MRESLEQKIHDALSVMNVADIPFVIEYPQSGEHGDVSTNAALVVAKKLKKNPRQVAELLIEKLESDDSLKQTVDRIEVAGPGFVNFFLSRSFFQETLIRALEDNWGHIDVVQNERVIFEYTSPNLFKPLHIGNLVGNIIGESLSRLFEAGGALVHRVNYPSDIGLSVAKGVWGLLKTKSNPHDILAIGEAYRLGNEAYEKDGEEKEEIKAINQSLYSGDDEALCALKEAGLETSKKHLQTLLKKLGTTFDATIYESDVSDRGASLVRHHLTDGVFVESNGAIIYEGENRGLHTRVFINSQGLPTYEAKDVGNFSKKRDLFPDWTRSIVVTGSEQSEYFKVIFSVIRELFDDARERPFEHIKTGFLTLTTGKMSSRKGNVLTAESLLQDIETEASIRAKDTRASDPLVLTKQIAVAAIKYQILRQSPGVNIIFDKKRALSFEGDSGPYLQYTYARIRSVIEKSNAKGVVADTSNAPLSPYALERFLVRFEHVILTSLTGRAPHLLVAYLTELAGLYNSFYAQEKIADTADPYAPYKTALSEAVGNTIERGLYLLGIEAPERM